MEGKLVDREVPELKRGRSRADRFLRVLVASIVSKLLEIVSTPAPLLGESMTGAYPDIKTSLHQDEWQHLLSVCETDPHLAVHQEAMMHVDDTLLHAVGTRVDLDVFLASFPCEPMQAQEIPIIGLNNVFLSCVTVELAEFDKIGCVPDGFRHLWRVVRQYVLLGAAVRRMVGRNGPFFLSDSFLSLSCPHLLNKRREAL